MNIQANTIKEYFAAAGEREPDLQTVDQLIREAAPDLERALFGGMTGTMIGYGMFHYKGKSGREGDWPIIALANQKNYISLYICAVEDGKYIAEKNADRLGKVSVGRSCVRFKKLADLNLDVAKEIISDINTRVKSGEKLFGV